MSRRLEFIVQVSESNKKDRVIQTAYINRESGSGKELGNKEVEVKR